MDKYKCSKCGIEKLKSDFHKDSKGKNGIRCECKECVRKRNLTYDKTDNYKKWCNKNKLEGNVVYWNKRASRANERALAQRLTSQKLCGADLYEKFSQYTTCVYCGTEITHTSCHIEHIIPLAKNGSNTIDNITFSCGKCNFVKNDKTDIEFFKYITRIYNNLRQKYT